MAEKAARTAAITTPALAPELPLAGAAFAEVGFGGEE